MAGGRGLPVMLLAAGRGERMRPLTDSTPKPLLEAGGRPLIVHHLQRLRAAGFDSVVVNHAWLGERIEQALGDGGAFGVRIRYSAEGTALETAGGIARALPLLARTGDDAPFLCISADVFCDFDFGRARTIALQMAASGDNCWCVMVDNPAHHSAGDFTLDGGRLLMATATTTARFTYGGIGLFRPSLFQAISPGTRMALRPILDREVAAGRAAGEHHAGLWFDIGTAKRLADLNRMLGQ